MGGILMFTQIIYVHSYFQKKALKPSWMQVILQKDIIEAERQQQNGDLLISHTVGTS